MRKKTWVLGCLAALVVSCGDSGGLESSEALLGAAGGTVQLPNGTKVEVPMGALSADVLIRLTEIDARDVPAPPAGVVHGRVPVAFTPHGTVFVNDVKVTLPHSDSPDRKVVVRLADENDGIWKIVPNSREEGGSLSVLVRKFSIYSVFEGPQPLIPGPSFEGSSATLSMALGDLDNDGDVDVITGHDGPNAIFLNDGTGALEGPLTGPGTGTTTALAVGDPYDYGYAYLIFLGQSGAYDELWWNDDITMPGSVFNFYSEYLTPNDGVARDTTSLTYAVDAYNATPAVLATATDGTPLLFGDVDGWLDLGPAFPSFVTSALMEPLTGNPGAPDILFGTVSAVDNPVWRNDTMGNLNDIGTVVGNASARALAAGDVDGDGDLDIWVGTDGNAPDEVWIYDSGQVLWMNSGQQLGMHNTQAVAMGDLDGDGDVDAFVATDGPDFVYWNDGSGTFAAGPVAYGEAKALDVFLQDMDGDLDLDVVVANADAPNQVWLQD